LQWEGIGYALFFRLNAFSFSVFSRRKIFGFDAHGGQEIGYRTIVGNAEFAFQLRRIQTEKRPVAFGTDVSPFCAII
jgi:hypothetical protein